MSSQLLQHNSLKAASGQSLSFDDIADFFSMPLYDAATTLGVGASLLKKICREHGLERWPYRKFLAGKSIEDIKRDAASMSKLHRQSVQSQIIEPSKLQGVQEPGSKNISNGQAQNFVRPTLNDGMATSDEFKYGFPADGLSTVTNKWWGSGRSDVFEGISEDGTETEGEDKLLSEDKAADKNIDERKENRIENNTSLQGAALLKAVRKTIAEDGRKALELGVHRGYVVKKLDRRQQTLLRRIFKSSLALPKDWTHVSS